MPHTLAVCANKHYFPAGMGFDPGDSGITGVLTVESVPRICPECGAHARVLGGSYHVAKDTIELLQGPERTVSELERLREILRVARETGASAEEVRSTVEHEFPDWGQVLSKLLVPKTPADLTGYLMLIIAIITALLAYEQLEQAKDAEPDQIINNITVVQEAPTIPGQPQVAPSSNPAYGEKIGRNEPCPCGTGKKYKTCHGANGETRYYGP